MNIEFSVEEAYRHLIEHRFVFTIRPYNPRAFRFARVSIVRRNEDGVGTYDTGFRGHKVLAGRFFTKNEVAGWAPAAEVLTPAIVRGSGFRSLIEWLGAGKREGFPDHDLWNLFYVHLVDIEP